MPMSFKSCHAASIHFFVSLLGLRESYLADLQKTYENLTTNLGKILRSFENQAPV